MKNAALILLLVLLPLGLGTAGTPGDTPQKWPHPVPARIADGANKDLMVMTLGDVETPLADGTFDPAKDQVTLNDGTLKPNYYRETLGVKYYRPIDKSRFSLPPSGWCSWYYYYQQVNENEVMRNAKWISEKLKDYGAQYIQIDDGWQGVERKGSRDWTTIDKAFPAGMERLAAYIKSQGLTPGIWLAPHGQTNEAVVKANPGVFLLKPDGTSASETWEGKWLVDPSTPESLKYLINLFTTLTQWGYEYFKIDGQPIVVNEYRQKKSFMKNPSDDTNALYRTTLETIRGAIGPDRYLLGCWGTPIEGVGIMNGSRTGGDIVLGWDGFRVALRATMRGYYLHNIVWYADPDVMLVRSPLTIDQARAWATLQGLTGQALLSSDRLMDLSEERVEIVRRVYPAVDIRPLDLFPSDRNKRIWDLKVNHLGRQYDVVGVFNFDDAKADKLYLSWKELGLRDDRPVHVFDFWNQEYLGAWEKGYTAEVAPTSVRVLALVPMSDQPQLVSTSRHITQGWVDLLAQSFDALKNTYSGKSKVVKDDPYKLYFAFPRGKNMAVKSAVARGASGVLSVKIWNHQGWASVEFTSPKNAEVSWEVVFEPSDIYPYPIREPGNVRVERVGTDGANLHWDAQYYLSAGYQVYLNGELLGYAPSNSFPLRGLDPRTVYSAEVKTVWDNGAVSEKAGTVQLTLQSLLPAEISLAELEPQRPAGERGFPAGRVSATRPLNLGGVQYESGLLSRGNSASEYDLLGLFNTFEATVGVDAGSRSEQASFEFIVLGDGKELWRSGPLKQSDEPKAVRVDITGVQRLILRVTSSGPGQRDFAGWANARLGRKPR